MQESYHSNPIAPPERATTPRRVSAQSQIYALLRRFEQITGTAIRGKLACYRVSGAPKQSRSEGVWGLLFRLLRLDAGFGGGTPILC